jgi:pterin-4a-carbinolamine dehydratase
MDKWKQRFSLRAAEEAAPGTRPVKLQLKPERIQELLRKLPGWRLCGHGLVCARETASGAAAIRGYVNRVIRLATLRKQPVTIAVASGEVVVTLPGHPARGCVGGVTEAVFKLAELIG